MLFQSCSTKSKKEGYYFQDFEDIPLWLDSQQLAYEYSRSGSYSTKMDEVNNYSLCFKMPVGEILKQGFTKAEITAWVALSVPAAKCTFITSIESNEKAVVWNGIPFSKVTKTSREWRELKTTVDFKEDQKELMFKVYGLSDNKERGYMDDISIQFLK